MQVIVYTVKGKLIEIFNNWDTVNAYLEQTGIKKNRMAGINFEAWDVVSLISKNGSESEDNDDEEISE